MDYRNILIFVVIGCLLVVGRVSAYYNQTYGSYSFVLSDANADNSQGKAALTNAQDWCRSNGYTLAAIPNKEVQGYIKQFISSAVSNGLMTDKDLIMLNGKLYTSLPGTWIWVNGQQVNGVNIQDQRDPSQRYFYGFLRTSDYKIYASTHNNGRPFICEKPGNANDCVGGLSLNGRCYQRNTNSLTWYSARNDCAEGGGDLASFEILTDSTFRSTLGSTLLANETATEYWVGIQRAEWRWEDTGLAIKYTNWESGSPSNDKEFLSLRMTTSSNWLWYNYDCSLSCRFICLATSATTSTVNRDTSSNKPVSGSYLSFSTLSSVPKAFTTSTLPQPSNNEGLGLGFGQGVGVGIGIGLGVMVIVLVIIFMIIRRHLNKRTQNDAKREANEVQASPLQQLSTFPSTALPNKNTSSKTENHLGRTTANTADPYETLQSTDARSPESPYQQLDSYEAPN